MVAAEREAEALVFSLAGRFGMEGLGGPQVMNGDATIAEYPEGRTTTGSAKDVAGEEPLGVLELGVPVVAGEVGRATMIPAGWDRAL